MQTKTLLQQRACGICGKRLRDSTITREETRGSNLYVFEDVPVQVCAACGEIWIEEKTRKEIARLINEDDPTQVV